jgi:molecular chaperone GrpE
MKKQDPKTETIDPKEVEELKKQSEAGKREAEEWKGKYLRALADYQNLDRRTQNEKEEIRKFASAVTLERLFPAIDTLRKAKDHLNDAGLDLAFKECMAVLEEQGVEKIQTVGKDFNPHEMECIEVVQGEENKVVEELLPGYRLHGKVLRVAQVKVGKKQSN